MKKIQPPVTPSSFQYLDSMSELLDSRFRIPGTKIRFGLDFLIGLVPFAGDVVTFAFSGALVLAMVRHGASGKLVMKMLGNVLLDSVVGSIPLVGDLFDLGFKANRRNYQLLQEHYQLGKHTGSAVPIIIAVVFALLLMAFLIIFMVVKMAGWILDQIPSF